MRRQGRQGRGRHQRGLPRGQRSEEPDLAASEIRQRFQALGVDATLHVRRGTTAQAITSLEADLRPDVVVMGSTRRSQLAFHGLGGVLDQVKNLVQASILVVRGADLDGIAAGIDGSGPSLEAAEVARSWAAALGVPFRLLVAEGVTPPEGLASGATAVKGAPVPFLLAWSRQNPRQLLALGSRGHGNPWLLELGSVSDRLAWGAKGSVLVVRSAPGQEPPP